VTDEWVVQRVVAPPRTLHSRVRAAARRPAAWWQLVRFALVGASGYVVNLAVFAFAVEVVGAPYPAAATLAFLVAVSNNFLWHRRWTFRAAGTQARDQVARFLVVSVLAFLAGLLVLTVLVELLGVPEVPAQAVAIVTVTPLSFVANKLWTFGR
jgi:dolichol-phosphate mannosyltransferase